MVKALLALVGVVRSAWLIEAAGAALIVAGIHDQWGDHAAAIAAGSALILKAYEIDARQ